MYKNLKKKSEGFTIIEVLIVLAIAALIMLIVFIAVPALQRNARNNEIRNQASRVATAAMEFRTNANDQVPTSSNEAALKDMAKVDGTVKVEDTATPDEGDFNVFPGGTCNGITPVASTATPRPRKVAVQFGLAGDAGSTGCIES